MSKIFVQNYCIGHHGLLYAPIHSLFMENVHFARHVKSRL